MKKTYKVKKLKAKTTKNPVAKFAFQFNKAQVFKDKTKYQRHAKHNGKEPFSIRLLTVLKMAFASTLKPHQFKPLIPDTGC